MIRGAVLAALIALPASAQTTPEPDINLPYAWLEFCGKTQSPTCRVQNITTDDLAVINYIINTTISPQDDPLEKDTWQPFPADRIGDCDDYAVSKMQALLALGVPPADMRLAAGKLDNGEKHIVLEVTLSGVVWVLDNRTPDSIYPPEQRPYAWQAIATQTSKAVIWSTK